MFLLQFFFQFLNFLFKNPKKKLLCFLGDFIWKHSDIKDNLDIFPLNFNAIFTFIAGLIPYFSLDICIKKTFMFI